MSSFCTICELEFSKKSNLEKHLLSDSHNMIFKLIQKKELVFQKKLEEANLENEKERKLAIQREERSNREKEKERKKKI
jgi:hypothetical protein